jgi:hypothetical protein
MCAQGHFVREVPWPEADSPSLGAVRRKFWTGHSLEEVLAVSGDGMVVSTSLFQDPRRRQHT